MVMSWVGDFATGAAGAVRVAWSIERADRRRSLRAAETVARAAAARALQPISLLPTY
jgi:hypothetical protein